MRHRPSKPIQYQHEKRRGSNGAWLRLIAVLGFMVWGAFGQIEPAMNKIRTTHDPALIEARAEKHNGRIEMYSLSTCGNCKITARNLHAAGMVYTEYMIDKDSAKHRELSQRLRAKNVGGGSISVPVIFVNDKILVGRQSAASIQAALQ